MVGVLVLVIGVMNVARGGVDFFDLWILEVQTLRLDLGSFQTLADVLTDIAETLDYCLCARRLVVGKQLWSLIFTRKSKWDDSSAKTASKSRISRYRC